MQVKSTIQNGTLWRIFHGGNYLIGGVTFLLGSLALLPFLSSYFNIASVSAWLYTVGSFTFVLADFTEWLHYTYKGCPFLSLSFNFFISFMGSAQYLAGSIFFIPACNLSTLGSYFFIVGSAFVIVSQSWKTIRTVRTSDKSELQLIDSHRFGFFVDLLAGLGGLMYFIGTFVIMDNYDYPGVSIYCLGGLFFTISAFCMQKRYFWRKKDGKPIVEMNRMLIQ